MSMHPISTPAPESPGMSNMDWDGEMTRVDEIPPSADTLSEGHSSEGSGWEDWEDEETDPNIDMSSIIETFEGKRIVDDTVHALGAVADQVRAATAQALSEADMFALEELPEDCLFDDDEE